MNRWSRRRFLAASTLASAALPASLWPVMAGASAASSDDLPEMVVLNARIFTSDPSRPTATAFTIRQGRIGLVGSTRPSTVCVIGESKEGRATARHLSVYSYHTQDNTG
jgi:hypothetical protein